MYAYTWDPETGGLLLNSTHQQFSKEPRPVYYRELDILGFNKYFDYDKNDSAPIMWAEANNYIYRGEVIAQTKGGSLVKKPELIIKTNDFSDHSKIKLIAVDVKSMIQKNKDILEALVQQTIKKVYNTYLKYQKRIDVFYVAFSGGKDSIVTLDIVQRALAHNAFKVLFGDTGMEYPDTYVTVSEIKKVCEKDGINFIITKSDYKPEQTWSCFGPPATVNRWCCSVHKTVPQILALREYTHKANFTGLAFVGVRASESASRSDYDYISLGEKHKGQYSCNPILEWNSAELYLYIFTRNLYINEAYKKGNRRAGCLVCPRAAERSDYFANYCYHDSFNKLIESIKKSYANTFSNKQKLEEFVNNGGWKARKNGRDLSMHLNYTETKENGKIKITINKSNSSWREWIKTLGVLQNTSLPDLYKIKFKGISYEFSVHKNDGRIDAAIDANLSRTSPLFVKLFKSVFHKTSACIGCRECEANCHNGYIHMEGGKFYIDDNCTHCTQCHNIPSGCLLFKSLEIPKNSSNMTKTKSLNCYSHHAPKMEWFEQFFEYKVDFDQRNSLGSQMFSFFKRFLRDAELLDKNKFSDFAVLLSNLGLEDMRTWALMFVNLSYTPQINWLVNKVDFNDKVNKEYITTELVTDGAKEQWVNDIWSSFSRLMDLPFNNVGMGSMQTEKNRKVSFTRMPWGSPNPEVILYSLYRFAEACGDYYKFTLTDLANTNVDRDGVSPMQIFGISKDDMKKIITGLSANYPDFISASFTLGLDNINLHEDKSSKDVLNLIKK